jgi:hypothetical protein
MAGEVKIKKIAFGNKSEAFIEDRFINAVNIIFSKSNNKGKTLLIQGLLFSIGNEPIFPSGFDFKEHYFYSKISIDSNEFEFLRKGKSIIIKTIDYVQLCNTISEFKHFVNQNVFKIPSIIKEGRKKIVDPHLLYEIFFLGQDNRNPSNPIIRGQYNKADFIDMVCSIGKIDQIDDNQVNIKEEKATLQRLKQDLKNLKKKLKIVKSDKYVASFTQSSADLKDFENKKSELEKINKNLITLKKDRNREFNRKVKLENLLLEITSLNQNLNQGQIHCGECGSDKIVFTNQEFNFEVSNSSVRNRIITSIKSNIEIKEETVNEYDDLIKKEQDLFNSKLNVTSPELDNFILFKNEIIDSSEIDSEILEKQSKIDKAQAKIESVDNKSNSNKEDRKAFLKRIIDQMNAIYKEIDPNGNLVFNDLFSKRDETFSGSEGQEFYFSKLVSLFRVLQHDFPIINDSFRSGEVSTDKERKMLEIYESLEKQVIVTSTLKEEEYATDKYTNTETINVLDYNGHDDSKILNSKFSDDFMNILRGFEINIE